MNISLLVGLIACIILVGGCSTIVDTGTLSGTINIGPLCPVESNPPQPQCQPTIETYKNYPISIRTYDGTQIAQLTPSLNGTYSVNLLDGNYVVDLDNSLKIGNANLPKNITITGKDTIIFDIVIDTGMR
jgi:hypothetical protein